MRVLGNAQAKTSSIKGINSAYMKRKKKKKKAAGTPLGKSSFLGSGGAAHGRSVVNRILGGGK